jgi:hypothetical protein
MLSHYETTCVQNDTNTPKQLGRVTKQSNVDTLGMMYNCHCISQYCTDIAVSDSSCSPSKCTLQASGMAWKYLA